MVTTDQSQAIQELVEEFARRSSSPALPNEAATRLLFVNRVLTQVLGWPVEDFNPEQFVPAWSPSDGKKHEYLDYHLQHGHSLRLVVEAKRAGKVFSLPTTRKPRTLPLKQLKDNHGTVLPQTIRQAERYCMATGTIAFVVTNGAQWIASLAFAHNVRAEDIQAVVFYGLDDIRENLLEFFELLSPEGIASQTLMNRAVSGHSLVPDFAGRLNDALRPGSPGQNSNYLIGPLGVLMGTCFGDLTSNDHAEMLEECYVSSDVTDEYLKKLESFVGDTLPSDLEFATKVGRSTDEAFTNARGTTGSSLLVVGRAGSGKSTFLAITGKRLRSQLDASGRILLHIDLEPLTQTHATKFDHDRLVDDVCKDILIQAEQRYPKWNPYAHEHLRNVFAGEIRRLVASLSPSSKGTSEEASRTEQLIQDHLKKPEQHLKAYLGYLDRLNLNGLILIDNVDRGTPEFEKIVFQLGQGLARNTGSVVVTSLRETTFHNGKVGGFLDVARHTVVTISPPSFVEVVKKRFLYVQHRLPNDGKLSKRFGAALGTIPPDRVFDFAEIMSEMLLGEGGEIRDCIQALAGTNIRRALEFLEDFATSPHTDLNRLFSEYRAAEKSRRTDVGTSIDAFLRSVMRKNGVRYREDGSKIANIFQVSARIVASHFNAIRILQLLSWQGRQAREAEDIQIGALLDELGAIGYSAKNVLAVLNHIGKFNLVLSLSKPEPPWSATDVIRLGAAGRYYLDEMVYRREYIQNVVDDTVIYDEKVFHALEAVHKDNKRAWPQRVEEKSRMFLTYLARREGDELNRRVSRANMPPWLYPVAGKIGVQFFGSQFRQGI
jgi:hypothetical protein